MTAVEDQDANTRAALVCHRANENGPITIEATYWADIAEARQAETELAHPCSTQCAGIHTVVSVDVSPPRPRQPKRR
ncbi:hypothetical protein A9W97_19405 [Mycobacterium gordonae]|nr:hypothetical protein [Mycobacterium gordonae]OBJ85545.1 hypothetical protein A9W97_19405 [Mycobacterium gordonae]